MAKKNTEAVKKMVGHEAFPEIIEKTTKTFHERNKFLLNQSLILETAILTILINSNIVSLFDDVWVHLVKFSALSFGISIFCFTISIFNIYQTNLGFPIISLMTTSEKKELLEDTIDHIDLVKKYSKFGIWAWRLGISSGLTAALWLLIFI